MEDVVSILRVRLIFDLLSLQFTERGVLSFAFKILLCFAHTNPSLCFWLIFQLIDRHM